MVPRSLHHKISVESNPRVSFAVQQARRLSSSHLVVMGSDLMLGYLLSGRIIFGFAALMSPADHGAQEFQLACVTRHACVDPEVLLELAVPRRQPCGARHWRAYPRRQGERILAVTGSGQGGSDSVSSSEALRVDDDVALVPCCQRMKPTHVGGRLDLCDGFMCRLARTCTVSAITPPVPYVCSFKPLVLGDDV